MHMFVFDSLLGEKWGERNSRKIDAMTLYESVREEWEATLGNEMEGVK